MKISNFIPAVLGILGLTSFGKEEGVERVSAAEAEKLKGYGFQDSFIASLNEYLANGQKEESSENQEKAVMATLLGQTTSQLEDAQAEVARLQKAAVKGEADHVAAIRGKESEIAALKSTIAKLSALPEQDATGSETPTAAAPQFFDLNNDAQLGGMQGAHYSLDRPYNQRARAALLGAQGKYLQAAGVKSGDFTKLRDDLGAFYLTPWTERIQSLLAVLPSITSLFPTESGHQDLEVLVNIWLGEFSQAGNTVGSTFDNVAKGSIEFDHETLRMYDVMFVHKFQDLKLLEKSWIGYLNREGSNSLKMSFIEYILVEVSKKLHNEREQRWINGIRKEPNPNVPGKMLEAADGLYEWLRKKIDGFVDFTINSASAGKKVYQIKPFDLPAITPGNIGEVFYEGTSQIPAEFRDTGSIVLYVPSYMIPWYAKYNETMYGTNQDYKVNVSCVHEFPSVRIKAIPNADTHRRIFWTIEGNIKTYDQVSGEMLRFSMEQQDWTLKVWSEWKESIQAEAVGYKYTSKADMDGSRQVIWCNNEDRPVEFFIEAEAADATPSALLHTSLLIPAAVAITDIDDVEVGETVILKAGNEGITIAKDGKFSLLTAAWEPVKGDSITLLKRADGKFVEISRSGATLGALEFADDDTTPSVNGGTVFVTGSNTKATAITTLDDAVVGTVYTIHGAGSTNASTIANSGNFVLTAAVTLSSGAWIKLVKGEDGKFYEVSRG